MYYSFAYKWIIFVSLLGMVFLSSTNAAFLSLIKDITDEGLVQKNPNAIYFFPIMLFLIMLVRAVSNFMAN